MNVKNRSIVFLWFLICLRYSNGCGSFLGRTKPKPPPLRISIDYIKELDNVICKSQGKESDDVLEIIKHSDDNSTEERLDYTINNELIINNIKKKVRKNNTKVYCQVKNGNKMLLNTPLNVTIVFDQDEKIEIATTTVATCTTTIAATLSTTLLEATDVSTFEDKLEINDQTTEQVSDSLLSSPFFIGGLVIIAVLLVILLTGTIVCFKRHSERSNSYKDNDTNHVVQYVQLELEATYSSAPLPQEPSYAQIVGVVKKNKH